MMADIQQALLAAPRPGASRRAQNKRDMQSRAVAQTVPAPAPAAKRLKVSARRTKTAPSKPSGSDCSDVSTHTSGGDSAALLAKAASCPPLAEGLAHKMSEANDAPGTPRILPLPPAAAVPAASKSPPPEGQPLDAISGTLNAPAAVQAAATADTAATGGSPSLRASKSSSPEVTLVPAAPRLAPISAPMSLLSLQQGSPPTTPMVVTPPPETPKMGRGRGRGRGRGASAEPRAGGYQGRFCGRLFLKDDEAKLASECQLVGPLVGCTSTEGGTEHDAGRHTLAKIVRAVASGAVRAHCSRREAAVQELEAKLAAQQLAMRQSARRLTVENQAMRAQLGLLNKSIEVLATAQTMVPLPSGSAAAAPQPMLLPAAPAAAVAVSAPKPAVPLFSAPPQLQQRLIAGFPQFAGPPLPAMPPPLPRQQMPAPVSSFPAPLQPSPVSGALAALPAATAAMLRPAAAMMPPMASFPMAAAFATHHRSAFAPVPRSPPSGGGAGRVMRPTAHIGVPPIALRQAGRT